jgi:hypothetical protein
VAEAFEAALHITMDSLDGHKRVLLTVRMLQKAAP